MVFKPGSLMVTFGRRGGGKTHAAVSYAQMLVEGRFPELGKWRLVTNIIFLRKDRDEFVTDYPEGVHHITTMKELFPIAADALEKGENILLILDKAQNFLLGEHNGTSTVTSMKTFMGIIRKFNIAVWLLSPATRNMGPSFRNFIDDDDNPGNVNAIWSKDESHAKDYLRKHGRNEHPRDVIFLKWSSRYPDNALKIPSTSWTTPPEKLKMGEFCYDHKASAEFSVGENFDFKAFISATGNVSSYGMVKAIRGFYESQPKTETESEKGFEEILIATASRIKSMGLTDESISRAFDIPATTLRRKSEQYGFLWCSDKSESNPDRYKKVKNTVE